MAESDKDKICSLLEKMLKSAESKDKYSVFRLNHSLEPLIIKEQKSNSQRGRDYDNFRQSCLLAFTTFPGLYDKMIADARKRFSEIKSKY